MPEPTLPGFPFWETAAEITISETPATGGVNRSAVTLESTPELQPNPPCRLRRVSSSS